MKIDTYAIKDRLRFIPDAIYLKLYGLVKLHYLMNLNNPRSFNEKIQWIKLHYHNPLLTQLVDKYEVRSFVAERIGDEYLVPLYGVFDSVDDFKKADLPDQFVVKCTHDSQSTHVCQDKNRFDLNAVCRELEVSFSRNWYWQTREWAYKDCRPRVIVEKLLQDGERATPNDYKFYCFQGTCALVQCDIDRFENHVEQLFTPEWESLGDWSSPQKPVNIEKKPEGFDEMKRLSELLSLNFPHVRVDWYCIEGRPYFGEMTFYTGGGFDPFYSEQKGRIDDLDARLGELFILPQGR